jgi:hypothetical protein
MSIKGRLTFLILAVFLIPVISFSQKVTIKADSRPLNEVLLSLSGTYGTQISFDDKALSIYKVSVNGVFDSPEPAISALIKGLPLDLQINGEVFVIYPTKKAEKAKTIILRGRVLEKGTSESLPYSSVQVNNHGMVTDLAGNFSYLSATDSIFSIRVSHLGYYIIDTVISGETDQTFYLTPSALKLPPVEIINKLVDRSTLIGDQAGMMKMNHQVADFLPGFGDNSVFNLLRLQPGILAAGEQTNELIIWGCYEGQSKVIFDGFTLYSLKNFNDNISAFNPLMAKDIEVYKGGYDAKYGERVGGIVNITGKNGNTQRPSFSVNINNMTLNGMVEIPLSKSSSLVFAIRHTYYELYNPGDFNPRYRGNSNGNGNNSLDVNIVPDYRFRDMNLKYSAKFHDRDLFYVSLYGGNDQFSYAVNDTVNNKNNIINKNTTEKNTQSGGAIFYGKRWDNGYMTNFSLNYSVLKSDFSDDLSIEKVKQQTTVHQTDLTAQNVLRETTLQVDNSFPVNQSNTLEGGMIIKANRIELQEDTFNIAQARMNDQASRVTIYFQDKISAGRRVELKAGFRLTQAVNLKKLFPEPRLSASVSFGGGFKINAAWGIYDQFITKSSVLDDMGNYRYFWAVCDDKDIPVLKSMHYVIGTSYNRSDWTVSLEGYYKDVDGLTRYIRNTAINLEGIYHGNGRSYGIDVMVKKDYKGHSAWIAYSLGKTEELFEYFKNDEYRRAPQDQRHEVKAAVLLNFHPFYFSADYVFGSGFPTSPSILVEDGDNLTYSRLDASVIYKFLDRKLKGEVGLSVLNVLNTQNIKYANYERVATTQTNSINIYSESIPITPALYFKLSM